VRKLFSCASALALLFATTGCGTDEPENVAAAEDVNATMNLEVPPPAENAANEAVEAPPAEEAPPPKATPPKEAPPKPKPAEPEAPAPDCLPEHRAAGHC